MILVGTGGHAKVVYEALLASGIVENSVVHTEKSVSDIDDIFKGHRVSSPEFPQDMNIAEFHVAIGNNAIRSEIYEQGLQRGGKGYTITHPKSSVSPTATTAPGCFIASDTVIAAKATIGSGTILNHNSVTDHDCEIGEFCHIAPGAILGGKVRIGDLTLIGSGAVVLPGLTIGRQVVVGAGSVVTKSVADGAVWIGSKLVDG